MKRLVAILMTASILSLGAATAGAQELYDADGHSQPEHYSDEFEYEDAFSNPLRLAYYMIYPVGYTIEWLVMRPLHYVISRPGLDKFFGYTPVGEEGTYNRMGEHM
jgi:hypothetical protein